jgi:ABC-type multidrug transport system ATPase subunit
MIIFKDIEVKNFRNLKHVKLESIKDLNILIGPNNCGKTNFLELLSKMSSLSCGSYGYGCEECKKFAASTPDIAGISLSLTIEDYYLKNDKKDMEIVLSLNEEQINMLIPGVLEKQRKKLESNTCKFAKDEIAIEGTHGSLYGKHTSCFIHKDIIEEIKDFILYCPEGRLQSYKEKDFAEYVREKRLRGAEKRRWINFLQKIIDPRINDERYENLIRNVNGEDFETEISKQGSGVRSLVCLAIDILFSNDKRIILIDEPELGLNPFVKQEFLKFLLNESKRRQIFIATQDPTFVNPVLWKNDGLSVYFYSVIDEAFHKIDLKQNQEDPAVFAGYLPHTVSLKAIHLYVEGTSDVYTFQIWLEKYLKKCFPENWFEHLNRVGIYHLCGDLWSHLLYTIPKPPYKCMIILDGDKRDKVEEVCKKYGESKVNASEFVFCKTIEDLAASFGGEKHPIYCLKENCIEKYLIPEFDCTKTPENYNYNKNRDDPKKAEELQEIPEEIRSIFSVIFPKTHTISGHQRL